MNLIKTDTNLPGWLNNHNSSIYLATATFMSGIRNKHTQASYKTALNQFFGLFYDVHPKDILNTHIELFIESMKKKGLQDATIEARLSALSALYEYLTKPQGASSQPLVQYNPIKGIKRVSVDPYSRSKKMSTEQAELFFAAIDRTKPVDARDYAYFKWLYFSSLRETEVLTVKKSDISQTGDKRFYRYQELKNPGKVVFKTKELVYPVWLAIQHSWELAERPVDDDSYIFKSLSSNGMKKDRHVDASQMIRNFQKYCRLANISGVTVHSIRHLSAQRKLEDGGLDIMQLQAELGHKHISTTQIYVKNTELVEDTTHELIGDIF